MSPRKTFRLGTALTPVLCAALLACFPNLSLATAYWTGTTDNDWGTTTNWTSPTTGDIVRIDGGSNQPVVLSVTDTIEYLELGASGSDSGTLNIDPGAALTITAGGSFIGQSGTGIVNQTGGSITFGAIPTWRTIGGGQGTYNLSGGTMTVNNSYLTIGQRGSATVNISGTGKLVTNGSFLALGGFTDDSSLGAGTITQTGGQADVNCEMRLGYGANKTGVYNLNGGILSLDGNVVNDDGTGTFNIDGGTFNLNGAAAYVDVDTLNIGHQAGRTGAFTLASRPLDQYPGA